MTMACTPFRRTPAEELAGTTRHAAHGLALEDCGGIAPPVAAGVERIRSQPRAIPETLSVWSPQ